MLPDFKNFPEILIHSETIRPLTPEDVDVSLIRGRLIEAGIKLDLSPKARSSLAKKDFLTFSTGRGPGLKEAIGTQRVKPLLDKTYELMDPTRKLDHGNDKSPARGMRQWVADLVELAADEHPSPEAIQLFCDRTNFRVAKGYTTKTRPEAFDGIPCPEGKVSSVPPDSIPKIWDFLVNGQK